MKFFEIPFPGQKPSEYHNQNGYVIVGEAGRGRSKAHVPIIGEGINYQVKKTTAGIILYADEEICSEKRCLCLINTVGEYDRRRTYDIFDCTPGQIRIIESGNHAFGTAGMTNSGPEFLAIVEAGTEFRLNSKYTSHWYIWDGIEWKIETPAERQCRLAIKAAYSEEGEWL